MRAFIVAILTFYPAHPTPKVKNLTCGMSGMSGLFPKFAYYRAPARARNLLLGSGPEIKFFDGRDRSHFTMN